MQATHKPVLVQEVLQYLDPEPSENFVDGTCGEGGHLEEVLKLTGRDGRVLGIDWDADQVASARAQTEEFGGRALVIQGNYTDINKTIAEQKFEPVHGILVDLGYSSWHVDQSGKGFSFLKDQPLDMRYS